MRFCREPVPLRAYGTILPISSAEVITARQDRQQPPQPIYIVCSHSGRIDPTLRFFRQPVPRWLLTTEAGGSIWQKEHHAERFEKILTVPEHEDSLDWAIALPMLYQQGIRRLVLAGGGQLVASLLARGVIDELWLTLCPLLLGGKDAPTPVDGIGLPTALAPRLQLCSLKTIEDEVFLHYKVRPQVDAPSSQETF